MKEQMTIAEAQEAIDEILDAIEADPDTRVEVIDDEGQPIAVFVAPDFFEEAGAELPRDSED